MKKFTGVSTPYQGIQIFYGGSVPENVNDAELVK
jgi:hypothetical protein